MGTFNITIEVGDRQGEQFEEVEALVDTGAVTTMLPASMLRRLGVIPTRSQVFAYAGGEEVELGMAETKIRIGDRLTTSWVIFGEEGAAPLLGSYTLQGLLLGVDPYAQRLIPLDGPLSLR